MKATQESIIFITRSNKETAYRFTNGFFWLAFDKENWGMAYRSWALEPLDQAGKDRFDWEILRAKRLDLSLQLCAQVFPGARLLY